MTNKLLLLTKDNDHYRHLLEQATLPQLTILDDDPANIRTANIWFAEPALAAPLIVHASHLQWLQSTFAGVDKLIGKNQRQDYLLTNIKGIFGSLMSEYVFGYLLAHQRHHAHYRQLQSQATWRAQRFKTLQGQRLLILGTGSIAQHIASTAKHFGMHVTGINRHGNSVNGFDVTAALNTLTLHLPTADAIVSVLPSTPHTQQILTAPVLKLFKETAVLCNIGRGDVLDLDALSLQLHSKPHQLAILDVFSQEPLPTQHPIWQCDNAIITPHIAAPSFPEQIIDIFCRNYQHWLAAKPLEFTVNFERGY
ncbi:D-2-hydroxyacid dehydrogenase [Shewanella intestini]|uniref:D-2-hydroxyacid dehydrogenase n=1 Tax=Shewanella intestini TaxID=2017544 RepID=A0ABS5I0X8_9GAMM|nr:MULTISPECIES: D-2-hydroxyacid dehydrogenase [Shewanella]MBR9727674.1 D-2-hydroxyacid dehydrogenase [Shewanella intestini]MRG35176.1 D-2-hydroxyacid dehydrogenase [Shewanella sp. XMDDZSB0408]